MDKPKHPGIRQGIAGWNTPRWVEADFLAVVKQFVLVERSRYTTYFAADSLRTVAPVHIRTCRCCYNQQLLGCCRHRTRRNEACRYVCRQCARSPSTLSVRGRPPKPIWVRKDAGEWCPGCRQRYQMVRIRSWAVRIVCAGILFPAQISLLVYARECSHEYFASRAETTPDSTWHVMTPSFA
jgi:hypothetical protein